jgi:hypothetical protein
MTLDNMRALGARSIDVTCRCGRDTTNDVSGLSGLIEVPALRGQHCAPGRTRF